MMCVKDIVYVIWYKDADTVLFSKKFLILSSNLVNDELDLFALSLSWSQLKFTLKFLFMDGRIEYSRLEWF